MGIKLGRIEGPTRKKEGETSNTTTGASSTGAGKIVTEALGPNFNPVDQNQSLKCEFHMDAPRHTTDNCYGLRGKLQDMIEKNLLSFNEVNCPNVQNNPVPDHDSSSRPIVNMIATYPLGQDEIEEEESISP
ncbi:hypothetical protein CRG98_016570 [Punica granatum]|uniref:Uncharacterized protein n=1 Tax=Punica granatum TaxID=22663 RepID=A0A2I0K5R3_PUNGR|nr:hypothetical protein CRG98_016570 [Punica granatum]